MARTYRRHKYHGLKLFLRRFFLQAAYISRPLVFILTGLYIILPWLLSIAGTGKYVLQGIGILTIPCAIIWRRKTALLIRDMEIIAAGHDGEGTVAKALAKLPKGWAVLNDLALRAGGPIVQIDHIIISPACLYVLETKTQKGQITACPAQGKWQVKRRGEVRIIPNPLQQNRAQVEACKVLLSKLEQDIPCRGLVVMTESAVQIKGVTTLIRLTEELMNCPQQNHGTLTPKAIHRLAKALLSFQVSGRASWQKRPEHAVLFAVTVLMPLLFYTALLILFTR